MSQFKVAFVSLAVVLMIGLTSLAQPAQGSGQGARGAGGVGFNAKNMQEQLAALKGYIAASDEEWKSLSPKVEKVLTAKQNMNSGAGMNWTSSNNAKPTFEAARAKLDTAPGVALQAIRTALNDANTPAAEFTKKMDAVREARQKARTDYESATAELIGATTPRQQATLMTFGVVE